jgi:hypothetical protein
MRPETPDGLTPVIFTDIEVMALCYFLHAAAEDLQAFAAVAESAAIGGGIPLARFKGHAIGASDHGAHLRSASRGATADAVRGVGSGWLYGGEGFVMGFAPDVTCQRHARPVGASLPVAAERVAGGSRLAIRLATLRRGGQIPRSSSARICSEASMTLASGCCLQ